MNFLGFPSPKDIVCLLSLISKHLQVKLLDCRVGVCYVKCMRGPGVG